MASRRDIAGWLHCGPALGRTPIGAVDDNADELRLHQRLARAVDALAREIAQEEVADLRARQPIGLYL